MSEPRKLNIDGGIVKDGDQITATYKSIPEVETEVRSSKNNLAKALDKGINDGADEKLLKKEDEAKIMTRVDMADAKYVVGDHRNGDAKIEIDAGKRQFSGLTKEELMKYADDPFWVRLRWTMFVLFWAMWFLMLAGAIAIIVQAPKCAAPTPKTWFEKGPLVDMGSVSEFVELEEKLPLLVEAKVAGVFVPASLFGDSYSLLFDKKEQALESFTKFAVKAKEKGLKLIVDLTANFVSTTNEWFLQSVNKTEPFTDYFTWTPKKGMTSDNQPIPYNNWRSTENEPAWNWSDTREEFYLHQSGAERPDLNFRNPRVVEHFNELLDIWMKAGASGVRLLNVRSLVVDKMLRDDPAVSKASDAVYTDYAFYTHKYTSDQPELATLLGGWSKRVARHGEPGQTVFTVKENTDLKAPWTVDGEIVLRPPSAGMIPLVQDAQHLADRLNRSLSLWSSIELKAEESLGSELTLLALVLPATPLLELNQFAVQDNQTWTVSPSYLKMVELRSDATIAHGNVSVQALANSTLLACSRWKAGHTGYAVVWNPSTEESSADVGALPSVPASVTIHVSSDNFIKHSNETSIEVSSDNFSMPPQSAVVLSYVPKPQK